MKLHIAAAVFAGLLATPVLAQSAWSPSYVQADVGAVLDGRLHANGTDAVLGPVDMTEPLRRGGMASVLAGRELSGLPVSLELEGLYLNDAIKSDDLNAVLGTSAGLRVQTWGALAGIKLEQPLDYRPAGLTVAPYVGAGVGYGRSSITILGDHYAGEGALWQLKAGLALSFGPRLAWDVGYRYVKSPTFDTNKLGLAARLKTNAQAVAVGVRYAFGPGR